jgi:hypothetical protein
MRLATAIFFSGSVGVHRTSHDLITPIQLHDLITPIQLAACLASAPLLCRLHRGLVADTMRLALPWRGRLGKLVPKVERLTADLFGPAAESARGLQALTSVRCQPTALRRDVYCRAMRLRCTPRV